MRTYNQQLKVIVWVLCLAIFIGMVPATALAGTTGDPAVMLMGAEFTGGYGSGGKFLAPIGTVTPGSIPISDVNGLLAIKNNLSGRYHLTQDIEWPSSMTWEPVGGEGAPFRGTFDGQGHIIKNIKITDSGQYCGGLFAYANANIKNVGLEGANINVTVDSDLYSYGTIAYAGGITGYSAAGINNCFNINGSMTVEGNAGRYGGPWSESYVGGIIGYSGDDVTYCYNTSNLTASFTGYGSTGLSMGVIIETYVGGINGRMSNVGTISNCYNDGDITLSSSLSADSYVSGNNDAYAGGICGDNKGVVSGCYNTGFVDVVTSGNRDGFVYAGGVCAKNYKAVNNCYNTGSISGDNSGGICGWNSNGTLNYCYNTGTVSGSSDYIGVGAICGRNESGTMPNCYWNIDSRQTVNDVNRAASAKKGVGNDTYYTPSLTTAQMKQQSSFTGFDFSTVWTFVSGENGDYPLLRALLPPAPITSSVAVSVNNSTYGTASASQSSAAQGTTVNLTANANSGYAFKNWEVISGGVTIASPNSANTSFTMLTQDVSVRANFEEASDGALRLTITPNKSTVTVGGEVTFTVGMGSAAGLNLGSFSFAISIPAGMTYKTGSGTINSAFKTATGMGDNVSFVTNPRLMVTGFGSPGYNGDALNIATFTCTVDTEGEKTVTLADVQFNNTSQAELETLVTPANITGSSVRLGHVTGGDKITIADVDLAYRGFIGLVTLTPEQFAAANITGGTKITIADVDAIYRAFLGLITL